MKSILRELKSELKTRAGLIRSNKILMSQSMREKSYDLIAGLQNSLCGDSDSYRYLHIVYCLLRGRRLKQIESKNRPGNEPSLARIALIWQHRTGLVYPNVPAWPETTEVSCDETLRPGA
jgi:hypothetical protein